MVCCRDCKYFDDATVQVLENGTGERILWCTFDEWLLTEDMIENGECEAYDRLDDDHTA